MPILPSFRPDRLVALALCSALLVACGEDAAQGGPPQEAVTVTTGEVLEQPWSDTIQALGTVEARESIMVTAKVSETVDRVHFESGEEVEAGAVLVTLSGNQQRAALAAAEAAAVEADRLYRRQAELASQQLIASASLDTQRAIRDSARAAVREIRANLGDRSIRAPFAGRLGIRQVSPGALVQPGTEIASLDDISRVYVDFPVPEAQLSHLAEGQRLVGRSSAWPGREFEGVVSVVDARVDPVSRAVMVRGDFPNRDRALRPGMLVEIRLERPARPALVVPEIAVVQVGRETFVYRVRADDTVEQAPVQVGSRVAGRVEVVEGLEPGDRIVVDGTGKLRPGLKIEDVPRADAGAGPPSRPPGDTAADADEVVPQPQPPSGTSAD
ncbi:efflux RND transporter periplasmic adaptor subunit [Luteimonas sp. RD2P54]|uniref:Efflux RND transporter periplasmic adaptor subunit n=1 Tax=Luteimonas endophytica TaxID=3042023 RepID=A0ABT6JCI0_9GAMM|nr:efflux RND transporter periplasmic adaptor subunit [Luteimonas endophytica]MDH5823883.1 efflux RND transporter periplasmic adaptor subunit [Luteimonas endophytica]